MKSQDYDNQTEKKSGGECYQVEQVTTIETATTITQLHPWTIFGFFVPMSLFVVWYIWRHTHPDIVEATKVGAFSWWFTVIICDSIIGKCLFVYHSLTPNTKILRANVKCTFALKQNFFPLCPLP